MNKLYTDIEYIRRYVNGELSPKEMFDLERAAQEDEMIMDLIMGVEFEKTRDFPDAIEEIRQRIRDRVAQRQPTKTFIRAKWAIAASALLAVGLAAYIFLLPKDQNKLATIAYQPQEETLENQQNIESDKEIPKDSDSVDIQQGAALGKASDHENIAYSEARPTAPRIITPSTDLSPIPKENSRTLDLATLNQHKPGKQAEGQLIEITTDDTTNPILEEISLSYKIPQRDSLAVANVAVVQSLKNQNIQAKVGQKINTDSPEQLRAKLNNMNIDPQTSLVLNQVLNQQSLEKVAVAELTKNKQKDTDFADQNYTYLANIKSSDNLIVKAKKDSNIAESIGTVTFGRNAAEVSKQAASLPVNGWKAFDEYLGQALSAQGISSGHFKCEFKIDSKGKPMDIQVTYTDNTAFNPLFIDILQKGPSWIPGNDAEKVKLEVKF